MRKIGGLALVALFALAGCAAPASNASAPAPDMTRHTADQKWVNKAGESFDTSTVKFEDSAIAKFTETAHGVKGYENAKPESMAVIGRDICEHYAAGYTTEDLRDAGGESLAKLGEAAISTVCG